MGELYDGKLEVESLDEALQEAKQIEQELAQIPADKVIWDFDDLRKPFPKDEKFNPEADNLADFFISRSRIIDLMKKAIADAIESRDVCDDPQPVYIEEDDTANLVPDAVLDGNEDPENNLSE